MDGEKDEKYSIKYKVQVTDKKEIKLTTPDNPEYPRTLRYGEKLD
jgi:predicted Rossmann fold nucleotide-binding protein DprA/Smf involved in DNA uptake